MAVTGAPYELTPEEEADVDASLAEAERGEFATDEEVRALWAKHGLWKSAIYARRCSN
jgi:predicted transcriptional regulator